MSLTPPGIIYNLVSDLIPKTGVPSAGLARAPLVSKANPVYYLPPPSGTGFSAVSSMNTAQIGAGNINRALGMVSPGYSRIPVVQYTNPASGNIRPSAQSTPGTAAYASQQPGGAAYNALQSKFLASSAQMGLTYR